MPFLFIYIPSFLPIYLPNTHQHINFFTHTESQIILKKMLVHIDSTAIHVFTINEQPKFEGKLLKANGVFLNFADQPIRVHLEIYIPNENPTWFATTPFSPDDIVEVAGTITNLNDNTITVCTLHLVSVYQTFITTQSYFLTFHPQINAYKCHVSSKSSTTIPRARTWLKAVGTIKTTTQIRTIWLFSLFKQHNTFREVALP